MTAMRSGRLRSERAAASATRAGAPARAVAAPARSCAEPLLAQVADVDEHHGSTARNRTTASAAARPSLKNWNISQEHPVGDDVGVEPAAGHDVDDVEDLEHHDGDGRRDGDERALDHRHDHLEEQLPLAGAVQPGRLE